MKLREIDSLEGLDGFLENASLSIHIVGPDGDIIWANDAELETLGYEFDEYVGKQIADFHVDESIIEDILTKLTNNETLKNYQARLKCKNGEVKYVLINSNVYLKDGEFVHTRCFTRDITEIVHKKEQLKKNIQELKETNKKLDDFTDTASHHLKESLRGIKNTTKLAINDLQDSINAQTLSKLHLVNEHSNNLSDLIDALLSYSRLERGKAPFEKVDSNALLANCKILLEELIKEKKSHIEIQPNLPAIQGLPSLLYDVFLNLISNALKYNDSPSPKVEIGFTENGSRNVFYVKDNGIGIPEKHYQTIFKIFKRLHGKGKYGGGNGAGLTIVKKIIEIHEGDIWLQSGDQGTTFFFTTGERSDQHSLHVA